MSVVRGECIRVITGEKTTIKGDEWWNNRPTNVIIPKDDYQDLKVWVISICKKYKNLCEKELSSWDRSFQNIDKHVEEKDGQSDL